MRLKGMEQVWKNKILERPIEGQEEALIDNYRRSLLSWNPEDPNRVRTIATRGRGSGARSSGRGRGYDRGQGGCGGRGGSEGYTPRGGQGSGQQRGQKRSYEDQGLNRGQSSSNNNSKKNPTRCYGVAKWKSEKVTKYEKRLRILRNN